MRKLHMKHMKSVVAGLAVIVLTGAGFAVHSALAASGTFYTDQPTISATSGQQFTVNLYEDSSTQEVDTVNVVVNYDATKLQLISPLNATSGDPASVQTATASSPFGYFGGSYANTNNGASSSVAWVGTDLGTSTTGKQLIGQLTFKALTDTGSTSIDLTGSNTARSGTSLDPSLTGTIVNFLDTTAPTISIDSPANNATLNGSTTVTTTASDNVGVSKVEFYVDGTPKSTVTSSPYSYTFDPSTLSVGSHTIKATAYDAANNNTSASVTVNVPDTTAPTVSITVPANNATISGSTTMTATASDNVAVSKVEFYVDGTLKSTATTSPYSYTFSATGLTTGAHTLKVTAYDAANNTQSSSVSVTATDTTAPTVSLTSPTNGSTQQGTINIAATANDDVAVTKVEFYVDGTLVSTANTGPYTYLLNTTALTNGSHTIKATAYDAANNNTSSSATITVNNPDTTAPTISINSPANNATISGSTTVTTTASDNIGVTKVEFYIDGTLKQTDNSSPFSYVFDASTLSVGAHTIKATAYDANNNSTDASVAVTVADITPPTVSVDDLSNGDILNNNSTGTPYNSANYPVSATASDTSGIQQVELLVDGTSQGIVTSSPYNFNVDLTGLTCGPHTIQAVATDNSVGQNQGTSTINVTVAQDGDLNGDCKFDFSDISILSNKYGDTYNLGRADINGDGVVDFMDVSILAYEYIAS